MKIRKAKTRKIILRNIKIYELQNNDNNNNKWLEGGDCDL